MMLTIKSNWYEEFNINPKTLSSQQTSKDRNMPFIINQFTYLPFIMHEMYTFGKFEIRQIQNTNVSPSISN